MPLDCMILTGELTREQLFDELRHIVAEFQRGGAADCEVEFGFAWDLADDAKVLPIPLVDVEALVKDQDRRGAGAFGDDDPPAVGRTRGAVLPRFGCSRVLR